MDYISWSTFKMGDRFINIESNEVKYTTNLPDWLCTQALLVIVSRNLFEIAFQRLSQFPILTPDARVTLKAKIVYIL